MIKLTKAEQRSWDRPTVETPEEREWLARLEVVRSDMFPLKVFDRLENGEMDFPTRLCLYGSRRNGGPFGCYAINLKWIKAEMLRLEEERRQEAAAEVQQRIGAFI
jgi:hypothetical protein